MKYNQLLNSLNEQTAKTSKSPAVIKINQQWLTAAENELFSLGTKLFNENQPIAGIPYEIDDSVETFEIVFN